MGFWALQLAEKEQLQIVLVVGEWVLAFDTYNIDWTVYYLYEIAEETELHVWNSEGQVNCQASSHFKIQLKL